ncbi:hypothetical protein GCM10010168_02460 [Actinoplanes ianthinogenes]|uniref:Uncharacterized protein n=1 Tax=Actinoplanes ianthinogenes TaxID=122358 RepID=A0ABM7LV17_9ACTN|nr:hypothetical protein Aiant_36700 [Actinoplanes ianthinogenes]GGQ90791.1 hypothetical protein GCM10010168_02460 [Actinoplanes ianthinogenes]
MGGDAQAGAGGFLEAAGCGGEGTGVCRPVEVVVGEQDRQEEATARGERGEEDVGQGGAAGLGGGRDVGGDGFRGGPAYEKQGLILKLGGGRGSVGDRK